MGLDIQNAKFLSLCKQLGVSFTTTLTLGRQEVVVNDREKIIPKHIDAALREQLINDQYADTYFKALGSQRVDACDASTYEEANIIMDLNVPPPREMVESYSCVIDLGTLEHVFHFSRALETAMSCVAKYSGPRF